MIKFTQLRRATRTQLAKMGIVFGEPVGIENLESTLRDAVVKARSQIVANRQICVWASI